MPGAGGGGCGAQGLHGDEQGEAGHTLPETHKPPVPQRCGGSVGCQPNVNGLASPRGLWSGHRMVSQARKVMAQPISQAGVSLAPEASLQPPQEDKTEAFVDNWECTF
ncbi:hypothetical protein DUI87_11167 [Hirundo rustica rustica]|uniref:Uncharacterized protein n=1 Tax=Hirundo rustica rustica TaxID=333673 RepID=A0A3M0KLD2_HIRRU|nr:hypothetical protein DUI87_11167 [Hirundo rustica rustica]